MAAKRKTPRGRRDPEPRPPSDAPDHREGLVDEGLEETFPASDPPTPPLFD